MSCWTVSRLCFDKLLLSRFTEDLRRRMGRVGRNLVNVLTPDRGPHDNVCIRDIDSQQTRNNDPGWSGDRARGFTPSWRLWREQLGRRGRENNNREMVNRPLAPLHWFWEEEGGK